MSRRLCQETEAQIFMQQHGEDVESTKMTLFQVTTSFLDGLGCKILTPAVLQQARMFCSEGDVDGVFAVLRERATDFVRSNHSDLYWMWVDAVGFFFDAISTRWPYLSQEARVRYLEWSKENFDTLQGVDYASMQ